MNDYTDWPTKKYGTILADPPWLFRTRTEKGRGRSPEIHYPCMKIADIAALPVGWLAADNCALFLWTVCPHLHNALKVIDDWGFTFKTVAFTWAKPKKESRICREGVPLDSRLFAMGTGYWTRANAELCLLATRGRPKRLDKGVSQMVVEPRREHSRKPDCVRDRIQQLVAGPYIELFARSGHLGFDSWGDEVGVFDGR